MRRLLAVLALAFLAAPCAVAAADDAALVDQLVGGSPWKGENIGDRDLGSVTFDVAFQKGPGGDLAGVVSNYSIPAFAQIANGPVKRPAVRDGVLTFETNRGSYELRPDPDGKWTGRALSLDKSFGAKVTLTPARK